jgi:hypothetical protein
MQSQIRNFPRTFVLLAALGLAACALLAACASMEPGRLTAETSGTKPVDPRVDNEKVLTGQVTGLIVTLKIDGQRVELTDVRVMMIPKGMERRQEGELVTLAGLSGGQTVTRVEIPDQRLNIEENRGIVILEQRTLQAALPLPRPIEELQVLLPGADQPVRFQVGKEIAEFCNQYPKQDLCRQR